MLYCSILEILCSKVCLEDNFDFDILAHLTPGFVGADLAALLNTALTNAISRYSLSENIDVFR